MEQAPRTKSRAEPIRSADVPNISNSGQWRQWRLSSEAHKQQAQDAMRALMSLQDWEGAAKGFERSAPMVLEAASDQSGAPLAFLLHECSERVCQEFGARALGEPSLWESDIPEALGAIQKQRLRMAGAGRCFGENFAAFLDGIDANPQAPAGCSAQWSAQDALGSVWGLGADWGFESPRQARQWCSGWVEALRSTTLDYYKEKLVENMAGQWESAIKAWFRQARSQRELEVNKDAGHFRKGAEPSSELGALESLRGSAEHYSQAMRSAQGAGAIDFAPHWESAAKKCVEAFEWAWRDGAALDKREALLALPSELLGAMEAQGSENQELQAVLESVAIKACAGAGASRSKKINSL